MTTTQPRAHRPRTSRVTTTCFRSAVAAVAAGLLLAGCGAGSAGGDATLTPSGSAPAATSSPGADATPAAPSASATTSAGAGTTTAGPAPTGTAPVTKDRSGSARGAAVLTAIRTADRGSYDRVVLEFDRPFGGYTVKYTSSLTEDPTGDPVDLAGGATLAVVVQGATLDNAFQTDASNPPAKYTGPRRVTPGLPSVKEVAEAGDFEATLTLGIGVRARTGFRVLTLSAPDRLVVDVAH